MRFDDEYPLPIPKLIEHINFNPEHKEDNSSFGAYTSQSNYNVKITSMRSNIGQIYKDNKWHVILKDKLLDEMIALALD
jgi:hypothetical protein